ncbi:MAG: flavodoxin-dependent (E)-4-hydroxy-3-methylbut-2-enyl-diphosphate synthase [Oscillospiraceae bacterium]|nr:flavodoxin-dependent (E)-4-hydroxy-3-methylbut-2-enyl-diphosphate synthase [Oscillospiraceae bacterium]
MTRRIFAGGVAIGGGAPVTVQSMCSTPTSDAEKTAAQILRMEAAGCQIVRVAVPDMESAAAIARIKEKIHIPLVADIHFDYRLALAALEAGVDKIRINPGNIGGRENVRAVAKACAERGVPIRIGVNGGSLEKELLHKYGGAAPEAMVESAVGQAAMLEEFGFGDICISMKSSSVADTVTAYRLMAKKYDYPLHIGVTEAGGEYMGLVKSAAGLGALLLDGIGDTMRVSLTAEPEKEITAAISILKSVGLRKGVNIISCPTCGRTQIDLIGLAGQVEAALADYKGDLTVAVMGCVVNGPGEASHADFGIAGGRGEGVLFAHGEIVKKVPYDRLLSELLTMIRESNK